MADTNDDKLVIIDETEQQDERDEAARQGVAPDKKPEARDERLDDDEDDDEGDERVADADKSDEEREREREEVRAARREKRKRTKYARERSLAELNELRQQNEILNQRLAAVEGRTVSNEAAQVEQYIKAAAEDVRALEDVLARAIAEQDGEAFAKATRLRDEARDRLNRGEAYRSHLRQQAEQGAQPEQRQPPRQQAPRIDPRVLTNAKKWAEGKDWYDPSGQNEESAIVLAIDRRLVAEGYDPRDSDYWEELDDRARKRLPEVYGERKQPGRRDERGGPPVGGARGGSNAAPSGGNVVRVSAERKAAMQEAGLWDDPVKRDKALRAYQKFDKENGR